jgi:hypothetical protein
MYINADSLVKKVAELKVLLDSLDIKINIIAKSEIKRKYKKFHTLLSEFNFCGYNTVSNDSDSDFNSRGIVVYVDTKIDYSIIACETQFEEFLLIKMKTSTKNELYFCVVYRNPNCTYYNNKIFIANCC